MIDANEWKREQDRLDRVTAGLQAQIQKLEPEVAGLGSQAGEIRKRFWEEVTVNASTQEDFEETVYSIRQQEALLNERERSHRQCRARWESMRRLLPSPYFGRFDYKEEGRSGTESIYIGVSSFADEDGFDYLVYDWRTPIASVYYDYSPGPATYETPGGPVSGEMLLKRQYQIRGGRLLHVFDTSLTIGDEMLQRALATGADAQMKSIVATIQKEQNAIIRDEKSRMLIVQGAAGSGKTSAALQRVAYLLYRHRGKIRADQIVLFSPNSMFNSYVSSVLPELGEENMQQTTFQEYLAVELEGTLQPEDPFDQIEYGLTAHDDAGFEARMAGIRYKASEAYLHALQGYAERLGEAGMRFRSVRFQGRELIAAERLERQFYSCDRSLRLVNRVELLREWLLRELAGLEREERKADWVREELENLDSQQYADAYAALMKKVRREESLFDFAQPYVDVRDGFSRNAPGEENVFDYADQEEELLRRLLVQERFAPLRRDARRFGFVDRIGLYAQLFGGGEADYRRLTGETGELPHWAAIARQTAGKLEKLELFYEDATPFLYLRELVEGARTNSEVRHVVVDEGQDYSAFQYAFLKRLFPRARMTVLGDFNQAIFAQATNIRESSSPLVRLYGEDETRLIRLVRSYRSTREIVAFTKALLPGGDEIVPFERSGGKPKLVRADGGEELAARLVRDIAMLQAEGFGSVAVIAKTAAQSREAYETLRAHGCEALRLVTKATAVFENGVTVIPAYLAKGVEFDAVLLYDASARTYGREAERKLFYTACTRAMHRLSLYADAAWTPLLGGIDPALYEAEP